MEREQGHIDTEEKPGMSTLSAAFGEVRRKGSPVTQEAIEELLRAAKTLLGHEQSFNDRARPTTAALSDHLRSPEHFQAMRDFEKAQRTLRRLDEKAAEEILPPLARALAKPGA